MKPKPLLVTAVPLSLREESLGFWTRCDSATRYVNTMMTTKKEGEPFTVCQYCSCERANTLQAKEASDGKVTGCVVKRVDLIQIQMVAS